MGAVITEDMTVKRTGDKALARYDPQSLDRVHARDTCAMVTPFFMASSSTLPAPDNQHHTDKRSRQRNAPFHDVSSARPVPMSLPDAEGSPPLAHVRFATRNTHTSVSLRFVCTDRGRVSIPPPSGDHGMALTPNICQQDQGSRQFSRATGDDIHLQGREHLSLLLTIHQGMMVLHRDKRGEVVLDSATYRDFTEGN